MVARKSLNDTPTKPKIVRKTLGESKEVVSAQPKPVYSTKKPIKPGPDPVDRPMIDPHGYGKPQSAPIEKNNIKVSYREKSDKETGARVRIYYAGKLVVGSAVLTPLLISSRFLHQLAGDSHQKHSDEKALHKYIGELLGAD